MSARQAMYAFFCTAFLTALLFGTSVFYFVRAAETASKDCK